MRGGGGRAESRARALGDVARFRGRLGARRCVPATGTSAARRSAPRTATTPRPCAACCRRGDGAGLGPPTISARRWAALPRPGTASTTPTPPPTGAIGRRPSPCSPRPSTKRRGCAATALEARLGRVPRRTRRSAVEGRPLRGGRGRLRRQPRRARSPVAGRRLARAASPAAATASAPPATSAAAVDAYREAEAAGAPAASLHLGELLAAAGDDAGAAPHTAGRSARATTTSPPKPSSASSNSRPPRRRRDTGRACRSARRARLPAAPTSRAAPRARDRESPAGPRAALLLGDRLPAAGRHRGRRGRVPARRSRRFPRRRCGSPARASRASSTSAPSAAATGPSRSRRRPNWATCSPRRGCGGRRLPRTGARSVAADAPWAAVRLSRLLVREGRLSEAEQLLRTAAGAHVRARAAARRRGSRSPTCSRRRAAARPRGARTATCWLPGPGHRRRGGLRLLADEGAAALDASWRRARASPPARARAARARRRQDRRDVLRRAAERPDDVYAAGAALALGDLLGGNPGAYGARWSRGTRGSRPRPPCDCATSARRTRSSAPRARRPRRAAPRPPARRTRRARTAGPALRRAAAEPVFAAEAAQALADLETTGAI